jgi:release factor glutamine methyltransferase
MTIAQAYFEFTGKLKAICEDREAENISDWIFENVTGLKRWQRRENQNKNLEKSYSEKLKNYLDELLKHKPVQYILKEAWFYKMKFFVNENVLIPRPETEELVEWIVSDFKKQKSSTPTFPGDRQINIIDIGTGSGCISIALKKELPGANITAIDVSEKALLVANKNAAELYSAIEFFKIDFLKENEWQTLSQYDIIASNPPYIPLKEKELLAKNVTAYEPGVALFVENDDPFIFYKKIVEFSEKHLNKNGKIYVEVHEEYAKQVKIFFENADFISEIKKDIYGKERMVKAIKTILDSP